MIKRIEYPVYILSSSILFLFSVLFMLSLVLNTTIYSERYYKDVFDSSYITKLRSAFLRDMRAQSSYTGIPMEVITAGIDDSVVRQALDSHITSVLSHLKDKKEYTHSSYPPQLFYDHLRQFIDDHAKSEGYTPTDEQYELLWHVAEDSAMILMGHINILDIQAVSGNPLFISASNRAYSIKRSKYIYLVIVLMIASVMMYAGRRKIHKPLLYILTSLWMCASLYLIPAIVFSISAIPSRLAIATPHIAHVAKGLADMLILRVIIYSSVLFFLTSSALVFRIIYLSRKKDLIE